MLSELSHGARALRRTRLLAKRGDRIVLDLDDDPLCALLKLQNVFERFCDTSACAVHRAFLRRPFLFSLLFCRCSCSILFWTARHLNRRLFLSLPSPAPHPPAAGNAGSMSATAFAVFARAAGLNKRIPGCIARQKLDDLVSLYDAHRTALDPVSKAASMQGVEAPRRIKCMTFCDVLIDVAEQQFPERSSADAVRSYLALRCNHRSRHATFVFSRSSPRLVHVLTRAPLLLHLRPTARYLHAARGSRGARREVTGALLCRKAGAQAKCGGVQVAAQQHQQQRQQAGGEAIAAWLAAPRADVAGRGAPQAPAVAAGGRRRESGGARAVAAGRCCVQQRPPHAPRSAILCPAHVEAAWGSRGKREETRFLPPLRVVRRNSYYRRHDCGVASFSTENLISDRKPYLSVEEIPKGEK